MIQINVLINGNTELLMYSRSVMTVLDDWYVLQYFNPVAVDRAVFMSTFIYQTTNQVSII